MKDREYGRIYYCHTDRQYLDDETAMRAHIQLGHQANSFISMPREVERPDFKVESPISKIKGEIKKDYADIEEVEDSDSIEY